eukprot:1395169-Amorphochlora_amoeboformis.AAC.2
MHQVRGLRSARESSRKKRVDGVDQRTSLAALLENANEGAGRRRISTIRQRNITQIYSTRMCDGEQSASDKCLKSPCIPHPKATLVHPDRYTKRRQKLTC